MDGFDSLLDGISAAIGFVRNGSGYGVGVWVLAIVLAWSGVPKLRRPTRAAVAISDFGFVSEPKAWQGLALGGVELALAAALVTGAIPSLSLGMTAALLVFFAVVIGRSLLAGKEFPCFCFGGEEDEISALGALRAGALGALAILLVTGDGHYSLAESQLYLTAGAAAAIVATATLVARYRRLLQWNSDTVQFLRGLGEET